jgi:hypothetical protein
MGERTQSALRDWQAAWARPTARADTRMLVIENFMFAKEFMLSFCIG